MSPKKRQLKFIDQTKWTIQKQTRAKSAATKLSGMFLSTFDGKVSGRNTSLPVGDDKPNIPLSATDTTEESIDESIRQFMDYPFNVGDSQLFEKELSELIQPAASYGFRDLNETMDEPTKMNPEIYVTDTEVNEPERPRNVDSESFVPPLTDSQIASLGSPHHQNEFRLINHYCRIMCNFYSVKDPEWNFYTYICDRLACCYVPLKYSLLAWSALHLSIVESTPQKLANNYYNSSLQAVMGHDFVKSDVPIEMLLITAYFLVHYDIMAGTKHCYQILRHVWSSLRIGRFFNNRPGHCPTLSSFGYQIVVWLLYIDIRSSLFSGNISFPDYILNGDCPPKSKRNPNIEYLSTSTVYEKRAVSNIFSRSTRYLSGAYGPCYPTEYFKDDELQSKILVLMMRDMMMFGRLIRLRNWLNQCGNSTEFDSNSLQKEIKELYWDNHKMLQWSGHSRMSSFHVLIENALIHAIIIYFDRICHPDIRSNEKCQDSASEILKISVQLKNLRCRDTPGSTQWPFPLFIAGVETTDVIYQNWILEELKNCEGEGWGLHLGKMRKLFTECIDRQAKTKRRVDIGEVMELTTGVFVL
ncbi:hypothetical protein FOA43_004822 [Brettanomyces nanus]|uniref:Transcription factor domain-containing protein n=1 Tax=Eeniella nana TaxID=13502 RepID=A0A875S965_EENNA|nr:uncharacterized protein FOA43_004822 [Brettanomyces nanus]QPG77408.1 hypothetical protein FOA43_004822 [Brettanomyces nanus]